jgi:hypothetical protein
MTKAEWKPIHLRLQGLRTLAARTEFVEEARNAGLAFIRLVIKYNLIVLDPDLMAKEFAPVMARGASRGQSGPSRRGENSGAGSKRKRGARR